MFIRFDTTQERHKQTQTPHDGKRALDASRGKK